MLKNESFYAIVGTNGYGLVKSWSKCARCMKYFKSSGPLRATVVPIRPWSRLARA